ncbi:hypothetical protein BD311DRAFT_170373 [Dichomitus squalens]|uniref:Uncharacterized protein n=1 Tax=Dichomitus squalens TaxID=114155 RepID=A0A4Q9M807_9APHY|nr:hypothetical protein BD311DRAFT_170373 [Dichomitus squalens]
MMPFRRICAAQAQSVTCVTISTRSGKHENIDTLISKIWHNRGQGAKCRQLIQECAYLGHRHDDCA